MIKSREWKKNQIGLDERRRLHLDHDLLNCKNDEYNYTRPSVLRPKNELTVTSLGAPLNGSQSEVFQKTTEESTKKLHNAPNKDGTDSSPVAAKKCHGGRACVKFRMEKTLEFRAPHSQPTPSRTKDGAPHNNNNNKTHSLPNRTPGSTGPRYCWKLLLIPVAVE